MELTTEQIKDLAMMEQMMDSGEVFWVKLGYNRVTVSEVVAEELGLKQGQTINDVIFHAILKGSLASIQAQIAVNKALLKEDTP